NTRDSLVDSRRVRYGGTRAHPGQQAAVSRGALEPATARPAHRLADHPLPAVGAVLPVPAGADHAGGGGTPRRRATAVAARGDRPLPEGGQPPSMTRLIAPLESNGWITRRPHPTDGRQAIVEVPEDGRKLIEQEVMARERWLDSQLSDISEEERAILCRATEIIDRIASR